MRSSASEPTRLIFHGSPKSGLEDIRGRPLGTYEPGAADLWQDFLGPHFAADPRVALNVPRAKFVYPRVLTGKSYTLPPYEGYVPSSEEGDIAAFEEDMVRKLRNRNPELYTRVSGQLEKGDPVGRYLLDEILNNYRQALGEKGYGAIKYTNTNFDETFGARSPTSFAIIDPSRLRKVGAPIPRGALSYLQEEDPWR